MTESNPSNRADRNGAPAPAIIILGVPRSGTTLLLQMLNHHSQIAIPGESYFILPLWARYGRRPKTGALLDDLGRIPRVHAWGVDLQDIRRRVASNAGFPEVIQAVYQSYADARGKPRFGDKTPLYIEHLDLLERVFPGAQYVHIVRDGRNAALSHDDMVHRPRFSWVFPQGVADFAFRWRCDVLQARRFGASVAAGRYFEVRYEDLVAQPEARLHAVCSFLGVPFEIAMLEYHRDVDPGRNHKHLAAPPTPELRGWRKQMPAWQIERFEAIAADALEAFGYERAYSKPSRRARTGAVLQGVNSRGRLALARRIMPLVWRSPAWRLRQTYVLRRWKNRLLKGRADLPRAQEDRPQGTSTR